MDKLMSPRERWYERCWRLRVTKLRYRFATLIGNTVHIPSTDDALKAIRIENGYTR